MLLARQPEHDVLAAIADIGGDFAAKFGFRVVSGGQGLLAVYLLGDADPIKSHVNARIVLELRIQTGRAGAFVCPWWE